MYSMARLHLPRLIRVRVVGQSMAPALNEGDWLLFRAWKSRGGNSNLKSLENLIGRIVLVQRVALISPQLSPQLSPQASQQDSPPSDFFQIKRVIKIDSVGQVWVEGDNDAASTDSRQWGAIEPAEVKAVLLFRYRKSKR